MKVYVHFITYYYRKTEGKRTYLSFASVCNLDTNKIATFEISVLPYRVVCPLTQENERDKFLENLDTIGIEVVRTRHTENEI